MHSILLLDEENEYMKILFISKESRGGIDTFFDQMSKLPDTRYEKVFCFYKKDRLGKAREAIYIHDEYPDGHSLRERIKRVIRFILDTYLTLNILRKIKPQVILACDLHSIVIVSMIRFLRLYKSNYVALINTNFSYIVSHRESFVYGKIIPLVLSHLVAHLDKLIFTSKHLAINYKRIFGSKIRDVIIPHSVDIKSALAMSKEKLSLADKKILVKYPRRIFYAGRLDSQKDILTLLKAFEVVSRRFKNTALFLLGDGTETSRIKKTLERGEISTRVIFLGWKSNIYKYLKYSDVFAFSSFYEGFAMVLVEAMALGIPVVSTDTPFGPSEIIQNNKYGFLVPVGDYKSMSERMVQLLSNKKVRLKYSKLGIIRSKNYDVKKMIYAYERLFISLARQNI